ncbi:MAG: NAD(P)/FAD-dependent oxidoreductase [Christensenellaceae bacterium]|nr:NAD(P)/FAD-dependent oxidoreductase [Christensenellaceae bacterium]
MTVIVIGGGPAGIMAAIASSTSGAETILIEKNEKLGKKLFISGKGRCNITNDCDPKHLIKSIVSNPRFMTSAVYAFSPQDTINFFETENLRLKVERGGRVFPNSDKAQDVINCFTKVLKNKNVQIHLNEEFKYFTFDGESISTVVTNKNSYKTDSVVLALGGASYPLTGSDGYGYKVAKTLGHTIVPPKPALSPIIISKVMDANGRFVPISDLKYPEGLSLKNTRFRVKDTISNKIIFEDFGEGLFTANGLSGPVILTISSMINRLDINRLVLEIDLKEALSAERLDDRILREFEKNKNRTFKNLLADLLPLSMIDMIISLSTIPPGKQVNSITRAERQILIKLLKSLVFDIESLAPIESAIVVAGGVAVNEIDAQTMRSKLVSNLYFAGEMIDVDALTGGFNIQLAISSGHMAGMAASRGEQNAKHCH